MKRREAIAGLGALGLLGAGGAVATGRLDLNEVAGRSDGDERIEPLELERFEAPGSAPGVETVPEEGRVTYIAMFATWCGTCRRKMDPLGKVADTLDEEVQFVSVTNEPVGRTVEPADVVDWWVEYDGDWAVAHDDDLELTRRVDARGVPYSVVLDADNRITWSDSGYKNADEIRTHIDEARDGVE